MVEVSSHVKMPSQSASQTNTFLNLEEVERYAKQQLTKMAYDYYAGGANTEQSVRDNRNSFGQYRIVPRILVDVSQVDTGCSMFGKYVFAHNYSNSSATVVCTGLC